MSDLFNLIPNMDKPEPKRNNSATDLHRLKVI